MSFISCLIFFWGLSAHAVELVDCAKVSCISEVDAQLIAAQNATKANIKGQQGQTSEKLDAVRGEGEQRAAEILNRDSMTLEEQQTYFSQSRWNFVLLGGVFRTLDELSDYYSSYSLAGTYRLKKDMLLDFRLGVDSIFYSQDGDFLLGAESSNPREFGLTDLRIGVSLPGYISLEKINSIVTLGARLTLPTSQISRDMSLYASFMPYAQMRTRLSPKLMSTVTASLILATHQYDDSNVFGTQVNSPLGLTYTGSLSYNFWKRFSAFTSYGLYHRYDYENELDTIQTFAAGLLLPATDSLYINFSYSWRDRVVTDDRIFNSTKSFYSLGMSYML